jgi:hypothetical protein
LRGKRQRSNVLDVQSFTGADCDTIIWWLQKFDTKRFNLRNLNGDNLSNTRHKLVELSGTKRGNI